MNDTEALVGLGSSMGDRSRALSLAVRMLDADPATTVLATSTTWLNKPIGAARGGFLNGAVRLSTRHSPRGLLALCKDIEARVGRKQAVHWGDRVVDLDLLLMGRLVRQGKGLSLPHPDMLARPFVMRPAKEVGPDFVHPVVGVCLRDLPPSPAAGLIAHGRLPSVLAPLTAAKYTGAKGESSPGVNGMKIFIDTANIDEIREAHSWGILDGVTTNPSLIAREGGDFIETIHEICQLVRGPVSAETVSQDAEGMIKEGRLLAQISEHVVVKVPLTAAGLTATRALADDGIDVNVTLIFQPAQALMAAKAGAAYVSPFLGRLDDIATDGVQLIDEIVTIFGNYPALGTEVLAASIRSSLHVSQVALAGSDVATIPYKVLSRLVNHPLTDSGNARFLADWDTVPDNDIAGQVSRWLEKRGS
jgi:transaldolase